MLPFNCALVWAVRQRGGTIGPNSSIVVIHIDLLFDCVYTGPKNGHLIEFDEKKYT